jgi:hypothetical protein
MAPGSAIIGSSSVQSDQPSPQLAPCAATKAAITNFSAGLAPISVLLASDDGSCISGSRVAVTGGKPIL